MPTPPLARTPGSHPDAPRARAPGPDITRWRLWQLADSAFPAGGFLHSNGLESARQHGVIRQRDDLPRFMATSLRQAARASLPFVATAHRDPTSLPHCDAVCDAWTSNHVAHRASRLQGKAFARAVSHAFDLPHLASPDPGHFAPVFGAALAHLDIPRPDALQLFLYQHLRSVVSAAIRLNLVGPLEAQRIQQHLTAEADQLATQAIAYTLDDLAQTAPMIDLWQGTHDRLDARLFHT
ncbi:MAG: urease accessory protein UreF [Verrucomicrobiales bacterium]|nr:urease accessory protein UreF [Verrucomicrobiales bacterium]